MPANSTGMFWHPLARETGMLGHLLSPGAQRGPWPWFPYALDNGAFSCWDPTMNHFDLGKWSLGEPARHRLLAWARANTQQPLWAIVPDVPGNAEETLKRWSLYTPDMEGFTLAIAVQNGMTAADVRSLSPSPSVICVGGSTDWKWETIPYWKEHFPRVHVLRVNAPGKLDELRRLGIESCDGTGWNRGNQAQTEGLERYCRKWGSPVNELLWPHVCRRAIKGSGQQSVFEEVPA